MKASEPEPVPDSLDEPVDWMTYTHQELYQMAHNGVDIAGATTVAANWARLGDALGEIGDELNRIVQDFTHAWQGEAADQAVHAVSSLATWSGEAGGLATQVSGCVSIEVDNAMRARNAMPAPPPPPKLPGPGPIPYPIAPALVTDQNAIVSRQHAAHRQAAETMEQFQADSRDVYHTVPRFTAPRVGPKPLGSTDNPLPPEPAPTTPQEAPPDPAPRPAPAPGPAASSPGPAAPGPVPAREPVAAPRHPGGPAPVEQGHPAASAASAGSAAPRSGGSPMGGMPMGGGARKEEDLERKSPAYVKEDEDIWGLDEHVVAPPVIGEDQGRA